MADGKGGEREDGGLREVVSGSGHNLDKTEVRAVMKPLQADSQESRLQELQDRYNLGKMVYNP